MIAKDTKDTCCKLEKDASKLLTWSVAVSLLSTPSTLRLVTCCLFGLDGGGCAALTRASLALMMISVDFKVLGHRPLLFIVSDFTQR